MENFNDLFDKGDIVKYKKKDIIISPKKKIRGIYQIKQGYIYSYTLMNDKKKKVQRILGPTDLFPLLPEIDYSQHPIYFKSLTQVTLSLLPKSDFFTHVYSNKKLAKNFIKKLTTYLNVYAERVENLELESVKKKLIGRLIHFASRFSTKKGQKIFLHLPLTHEIIAQSINVARENVTRELKKLEKEQLISFQKEHIIILNLKKLIERLESSK